MSYMKQVILIAHNLRSAHNVGSLIRTAEGLGVQAVYCTGYTPYPLIQNDSRLPHLSRRQDYQIHKTALGAEKMLTIKGALDISAVIAELKHAGYTVAALEQATNSISLREYKSPAKLALIVGREVEGIETSVLSQCDQIIEIPMVGQKESFNVAVAAAMALYTICA